jgi:hypothetical protein
MEDFRELERELGGRSGAVFGDPPIAVGTLQSGPAWSTIKVPLAIAALAQSPEAEVERAITESDNDVALALWQQLGPPEVAGAAVERVIAAAGDTETRVETEVVQPPYTSFGQTEWTLAAQQRFAAGLPALAEAEPVLELMRRIVPEQRWGFGAVTPNAAFKGGWGPDDRHLVRQFAILDGLAAAIANEPADGSYESGAANLTRIAAWVMSESLAGR